MGRAGDAHVNIGRRRGGRVGPAPERAHDSHSRGRGRRNTCQCNGGCAEYADCCADYQTLCGDDDGAVGCCHYDDTTCTVGDVCCTSGCDDPTTCTYSQSGCSGQYGQMHNCAWDDADSLCLVGAAVA